MTPVAEAFWTVYGGWVGKKGVEAGVKNAAKTAAKESTEALGEKLAKDATKDSAEVVSQNLVKTAEKKAVEDSTKTAAKKSSDDVGETTSKTTNKVISEKAHPLDLTPTHSIDKSKRQMEKLKFDIKENGIQETIKYVEYNGQKFVVDGHHRLKAAKDLGIKEIPVEKVELPYAGYKTTKDLLD